MAIKQIKKRNLTTQGFDYTDIGAEAQYVDVSYDANGNIIEDITEPGVVVSSTKSVAEVLNDIGPGGGTPEFVGTMAEWIALTPQQKSQYTIVNILDDSETGETVDAVTDGDMRAVTSNAVYDAVSSIEADNIVEISQADYDELTEAEKHNGKAYFIYDAPGGGGGTLDDLSDVEISLATDGQVLKYDGTNEVWVNEDNFPTSHATDSLIYGGGTDVNYGHNKLTDAYNGNLIAVTGGASASISASAYALQIAYNDLKDKVMFTEFKDITEDFDNGTFSANISKYKPGNYILKTYNGVTYAAVLADYNYYYNPGRNDYANSNQNHWVAIVMGFTAGQMNSTNTTAGGFTGSAMNTWLKGDCTTAVQGAFGTSHLIAHQCLLSTGTYNASGFPAYGFNWAWEADHYTMLMSEAQIYGTKAWSFTGFDTGEANRQLKIFQDNSFMSVLGRNYGQSNNIFNSYAAWLRDISASGPGARFARADYGGNAGHADASSSSGRFPIIMLK